MRRTSHPKAASKKQAKKSGHLLICLGSMPGSPSGCSRAEEAVSLGGARSDSGGEPPRIAERSADGEVFYTLREAQIVIESWRRHYNGVRPHASLGYRAPAPEVFVPSFAAWPAAQPRPAPTATLPLAPRPSLN